MCLYPKLIPNPKYKANKKNGGNVPPVNDSRVLYVPIGCTKCMECKKQKAREWQVRLNEEIREGKKAEMVTLTFSNEEYKKLYNELWFKEWGGISGYEMENEIAKLATRRFLERWRKKYKKSIRHWLVTELGHNGTENIHIHGILWTENGKEIKEVWKYGYVYTGEWVNEQTVNYIVKYIMKMDTQHSEYNPKILTSAGIGSGYVKRLDAQLNKYTQEKTREYYQTRKGIKLNLPIYYRNKIYTEEQREKLWIEKIDKEERWVLGQKISTKEGYENYKGALKEAQAKNKRMGYGNDSKNWEQKEYEEQRRKMMQEKRLK